MVGRADVRDEVVGVGLSFQRTWRFGFVVRTVRRPVAMARASEALEATWLPRLIRIVGRCWSHLLRSGSVFDMGGVGSWMGPQRVTFSGMR